MQEETDKEPNVELGAYFVSSSLCTFWFQYVKVKKNHENTTNCMFATHQSKESTREACSRSKFMKANQPICLPVSDPFLSRYCYSGKGGLQYGHWIGIFP